MRILLARHGETEWNRIQRFQGVSDIALNKTGKEQAIALARALSREPLAAIYTSPLIRAKETANRIQSYHTSVPIYEEPGFVEMDLGEFEGMEAKQWAALYPDFRDSWREDPSSVKMPAGENLREVQTRAVEALERIAKPYPTAATLLVCTHNCVICSILCHAMKIPLGRFREIKQDTAALNIIHKEGRRFHVETVNDRSHLQS